MLECGETSQLHLPYGKSPYRCVVGHRALTFLPKIRNDILNGEQTTWASADTRLNPLDYYKPELIQKIAIHVLGGVGGFNDFLD